MTEPHRCAGHCYARKNSRAVGGILQRPAFVLVTELRPEIRAPVTVRGSRGVREESPAMDLRRFEELTRRVSQASHRRDAVKAFVAALAAPVLVGMQRDEVAAGVLIVNC